MDGLEVLDTVPEPVFDAITTAAANACGVPIALVSLVDLRQRFPGSEPEQPVLVCQIRALDCRIVRPIVLRVWKKGAEV